ncbi:MAG: recombinase family protein [Rhodospirillales bacterium]|nr:recombinase family protein [Rhodospirillales bacterium]
MHILAAVAEHEREAISIRTKAALQAAKARGVKLGNPNAAAAAPLAHKANQEQAERFAATASPLIERLREQGLSYSAIAQELNDRRFPTARGRSWYPATVRNVLNRSGQGQKGSDSQ